MPLTALPGGEQAVQLADAGVRHSTPVTSYFEDCTSTACTPLTGATTPPHSHIDQLFVIVTSSYSRRNDVKSLRDPKAIDPTTGGIEDGRKILVRMFDLMVDTMHRTDLDDMLRYNDLLAWSARTPMSPGVDPFPIGSFNRAAPGAPAKPYEIALIAPHREDSDALRIFEANPTTQRERVFCGCIEADAQMQARFGLPPMADRCVAKFPAVPGTRKRGETRVLTPALCNSQTGAPALPLTKSGPTSAAESR
jgi:hypothetical protein